MNRDELVHYLDERLAIRETEDVSVNGLQVQGKDEVTKIALVTDAALAVYRKAADAGCDLILAHHGLIWGGIQSVTGRSFEHIKFLIDHGINLYAAHLPLDSHDTLGNNACLADVVELRDRRPFGLYHGVSIGVSGTLPGPMSAQKLASTWQGVLSGEPVILPFGKERIQTVGIVSGGGSGSLAEAVSKKIDCFVTGEGRHEDHHLALEAAINVIYLGHYRSETLGVKALGKELTQKLDLETVFIDEPTIV